MRKTIIFAVAALVLSACHTGYTPQPRATLFQATSQNVLRSAAHWDVLAAHEAGTLRTAIQSAPSAVYIPEPSLSHSPFEQAYYNMLTSHLVDNGVQVVLRPQGAGYVLNYEIQVVIHEDRKRLMPRPGTASVAFAIGTMGANVRHWSDQALVMVPLAVGLESLAMFWQDTTGSIAEVIVSSRLDDGQRLISADSRVYYFSAEDMHNFQGQGRIFQVVSNTGGNP
jgi:hypothetical protein